MRVTLAYPWTDPDGKTHQPDDAVEVDDSTGGNLIAEGWARATSTSTSTSKTEKAGS